MGYLQFTTGQVLTSTAMNQVGDSLVNVFASASARNSAISSPTEGMICYLSDSDSLQTYSGSAWADVGGGAFTQIGTTSFSAVASATIDSIPATYRHLFAEFSFTTNTALSSGIYLRIRTGSGTDYSGNYTYIGMKNEASTGSFEANSGSYGIQTTSAVAASKKCVGYFYVYNYANSSGSTIPSAQTFAGYEVSAGVANMATFGRPEGDAQITGITLQTLSSNTLATDSTAHFTLYGVN
jgi:hypothetical protein